MTVVPRTQSGRRSTAADRARGLTGRAAWMERHRNQPRASMRAREGNLPEGEEGTARHGIGKRLAAPRAAVWGARGVIGR